MPILDTEMWIGECEEEWGVPPAIIQEETVLPKTERVKVCLYRIYRKTMANRMPIHSRSAQPEKDKVQTVCIEFHRSSEIIGGTHQPQKFKLSSRSMSKI